MSLTKKKALAEPGESNEYIPQTLIIISTRAFVKVLTSILLSIVLVSEINLSFQFISSIYKSDFSLVFQVFSSFHFVMTVFDLSIFLFLFLEIFGCLEKYRLMTNEYYKKNTNFFHNGLMKNENLEYVP